MQYQVLRAIPGPEGAILPGAIVDVSGWGNMNVRTMISQRYIQPVESVPMQGIETVPPTAPAATEPATARVAGKRVPRAQPTMTGQE